MAKLRLCGPVIIVWCLLGFVASAQAECAWVLWGRSQRFGLELISAHATLRECVHELDSVGRISGTRANATTPYVTQSDGSTNTWQCLPDTIDPRGPKGK